MTPSRLVKTWMRKNSDKTLVVITGPTAIGKTETSLKIADELGADIISADARQFYRELVIGTAAPTAAELARVKHHMAGHLSIFDYYNVSMFEQQCLGLIENLFQNSDFVVVSGGSGLYIDALCEGIDNLPDIPAAIRQQVQDIYHNQGIEGLREHLKVSDPEYYAVVDTANPNRMMRGVEIFLATGQKYSSLRIKQFSPRPFNIKKIVLNRPRKQLFDRINHRTEIMIQQGLVEEAVQFFKYRHLNALNTVGYKELFAWMENRCTLHNAIEKIRTNTRRYAKRQLTWFRKYNDALWYLPSEIKGMLDFIRQQ
jgi:tRNA dimethylallyltransferase